MKKIFVSPMILFLFLFSVSTLVGQEFESEVTVNVKKLPEQYKSGTNNMARDIQNYIDRYEWTDGEIPLELKLEIAVILESITKTFEDQYRGRVVFFCTNGSKFADKEWRFTYSMSDKFDHSDFEFNSFTSMIDFYVYLILAEEMDKWDELGGNEFFVKAKKIANQGTFDRNYKHWWDRRVRSVDRLTDLNHQPVRKAFYYFSLAEYDYGDEEYESAVKYAHEALDLIEIAKKRADELEHVQQYFTQRHQKFAEIFSKEENRKGLDRLMKLDPGNKEFYERFN